MYETLLVLSVVVFAVTTAFYLRHPAASIFHPASFYLMFHGLVFVVRPLFAWFYEFDRLYAAIGFRPSEWEKTQVLICTNLGLIAFMSVILAMSKQAVRFRQDRFDFEQRRMLLQRFWIVALPLAAIGIYSILWYWDYVEEGGSFVYVDQRTGAGALVGVSGYFISAGKMLVPIVAIVAYLGRFKLVALLPFLMFAVLKLGTGGRGDVVVAATLIGLLFLYDRRRHWPNLPVLFGALLTLVAFNQVQQDRGAALREFFGYKVDYTFASSPGLDKPLETMDLANMEFFEYLVWAVPKRTGTYDYFVNNLQLFTEPIPRALWPDKPVGAPVKMFDLYEYATPLGATPSLPGMGWVNMGYAGVVIWCAFFALIYGYGFRRFTRSKGSNIAVITYCVFLSTSILAFRDGNLLTIFKQLLFYFIPVAGLYLAARYSGVPSAEALDAEATGLSSPREPLLQNGNLSPKQRRLAVIANAQALPERPEVRTEAPVSAAKARRMARLKGAQ